MMKFGVIVFSLGALTATGVSAQQAPAGDVAYCEALAQTYVNYIGNDLNSSAQMRSRGSVDGQVAVTHCRDKTATAIPVLERELVRNGFTLPKRG